MTFRKLAAAFFTSLALAGCFSGPPSDYRYYVLDYVPTASKVRLAKGPWQTSLLVRNFTMGEAYLRPELVYRTSAHEMLYHWRHRWAVRPEQVVSDMSRKHLTEAKIFRAIQDQYDEDQPSYELRGRVVSLEEYVTQAHRYAHLDLRLSFVRLSDGRGFCGARSSTCVAKWRGPSPCSWSAHCPLCSRPAWTGPSEPSIR
ncbi:MAG: membrane integrity-associated transporter subunit PqiC [Fibrobacteres bacterium]|nr:membrane integrity-associated transporter subunit PqiC [Fibrobacterota bacterium]